jgi:prephenate dehydratase
MSKRKVSFQGERGANSELAAHKLLGDNVTAVPCESFELLFDSVEKSKADYGIIPIENSLIGSIHKNYDLLLERNLVVVGETQTRIVHSLLAPAGVKLNQISKVYSHPAALDQCRTFFREHPTIAPISYYDTGGAARMIAKSGLSNAAAIASPYAAEIYNLKTLRKAVEDEKSNYTRFLLLSRRAKKFSGPAKTSIAFAMKNVPGALFKALSIFAIRDIDLTKIESRPLRKKVWQYYFYLDFLGSVGDEPVQAALNHLGEITTFIKVLGSYPPGLDGH